jgi:hypothetical protein
MVPITLCWGPESTKEVRMMPVPSNIILLFDYVSQPPYKMIWQQFKALCLQVQSYLLLILEDS